MFELARIVLMFGNAVGSALETIPVAEVTADRPVNPGTSDERSGRFELNWAVFERILFTAPKLLTGIVKLVGKPAREVKALVGREVKALVSRPVKPGTSDDKSGKFELNWAVLDNMLFTAAMLLVGTVKLEGKPVTDANADVGNPVNPGMSDDRAGRFELN